MQQQLAKVERRTARAVVAPLVVATAGLAGPLVAATERQITFGPASVVLTNHAVWSADSQWLAYDLRANPERFDGTSIELVNVATGDVQVLFTARNGAACGVVTWAPDGRQVVFIHGPERPTPDWQYGFSRRFGMLVDVEDRTAAPLDAMNYAPPFAPGALRGGSHVHQFSGDGQRVSFTYDDDLLLRGPSAEADRAGHQRNVGVAAPAGPVAVNRNHPRNHDGAWFAVVVTRTVARPQSGSDAISRACEEGWIGTRGYRRADGTWQRHALAFQGTVTAADGREHAEVFVVDLPDDLTVACCEPLEGTATTRPAPPRGTTTRRLTFTAGRTHRGIQGPRHWLRAAPGGSAVAYLARDDAGVVQLWSVPTTGGEPRQITSNPDDIASAFSWTPDGRRIAHTMDGSVCITEVATGITHRLTPRREVADAPLALACVVAPDGRSIAYLRNVPDTVGTSATQIFTVSVPLP